MPDQPAGPRPDRASGSSGPPPTRDTARRSGSERNDGLDIALRGLIAVCALWSVGAFLLDAFDVLAMPFTLSFVSVPASLLIVGIAAWSGRVGRINLVRRLWGGFVAGIVATAAYDAVRVLIMVAEPGDLDAFRSHPNFGAALLGNAPTDISAHLAGWAYHIYNGLSFAVAYAVIAGGARIRWAILYAMVLEIATIVIYPDVFAISRSDVPFIAISLVGHLVYGTTLGICCRSWLHDRPASSGGTLRLAAPTITRSAW